MMMSLVSSTSVMVCPATPITQAGCYKIKRRNNSFSTEIRVHTGKIVQNSRSFQGLLKDFPTVFKG